MRGPLACLLLLLLGAEAARTPKIYNALITSDENLAPSQAYPLVEPVLRTTSVAVAPLLQPLLVRARDDGGEAKRAHISYHDAYSLYPVAYDPYFQYGYHQGFVYSPPLAHHQQPVYVDGGQGAERPPESAATPTVPVLPPSGPAAPPHVNFQKNPDIPDVIPPLPFALRKQATQKRLVTKS